MKIIKKGIKSSIMSGKNGKHKRLAMLRFLMDYRNSVNSTTGFTPSQLVFGRKLRCRLDLSNPSSVLPPSSSADSIIKKRIKSQQCSQSNEPKSRHLKKGDIILYKKYINNVKFNWHKGVIEKRVGRVLYLIKDLLTSIFVKKHKNQLVKFKGTLHNPSSADPNTPLEDIVNLPPPPTTPPRTTVPLTMSPSTTPPPTTPPTHSPPRPSSPHSSPPSTSHTPSRIDHVTGREGRTEMESEHSSLSADNSGERASMTNSDSEFQETESFSDAIGEPDSELSPDWHNRLRRRSKLNIDFKKYFSK